MKSRMGFDKVECGCGKMYDKVGWPSPTLDCSSIRGRMGSDKVSVYIAGRCCIRVVRRSIYSCAPGILKGYSC